MLARGQLSSGMSGTEASGRGTYRQARAGLEARDCIADEWVCGFPVSTSVTVASD